MKVAAQNKALDAPRENRLQVVISVVDDLLDTQYHHHLAQDDLVLVWCASIAEVVQSVGTFAYDVAVLDVSSEPEPLESIRLIKNRSPRTSLIVLNTTPDSVDVIEAFRLGIHDYLIKPVNTETLGWSIRRANRSLQAIQPEIGSDWAVFQTVHEIKISDNAERMQALVREQVGKLVMGEGSLWLGSESLNALEAQKEEAVRRFAEKHPKLLEEAFESERANHPETWFEGGLGWIPLREMWMGGLFLWGVGPVSAAVLSRVEFLVRSLEISLESHRRYLEAKKLTFIDDVTHLHNARYLSIVTHQLVVSQKRFAVLFIDVDKFKGVNDKHGHLVGSALLVQMARILKNDLRPSDTVFRYGGDEFIAILHDQTREEAVEVAERLRQGVEKKRFLACGVEVRITISVGVALFPDDGASENAIVDSADKAMYQVKVSGRNSVFSFRNEKN